MEGIFEYLFNNPIQLIILIALILSVAACIVKLCSIGKKRGAQEAAPADTKSEGVDESEPKQEDNLQSEVIKRPAEKPKKGSKRTERPAPYPTMDGLEEHYLPTKPMIPIREATHTPQQRVIPAKAPIPTLHRTASGAVNATGKTAPIPTITRPRPTVSNPTMQATAQPAEASATVSATEKQADDLATAQAPEITIEATVPTVEEATPIEQPIATTQTTVEPEEEQATEEVCTPEEEQATWNEPGIDETADEQSTQAIESDTPIIETENMDSEVDFMKNSQSTNSPLAAKSLLAATQKMIGINPTEKVKPEPEEIVQQPTTPAKAVESEPKATAKTVESAPKPTAKAATKATPKEEEKFTVKKASSAGHATPFKTSAATFKSLKSPTVKKKKPKWARYTGKWVICRLLLTDCDDEQMEERYFFELRASNGEPLVTSEEYLTYEGAMKGIQTHKENILNDNFRIVPRGNEYVFKLLTAKNTLLCTGTPYKTIDRCESAVASAKRFAQTAIIQEEHEDVSIRIPDDDDFDTTEIDEAYIKGRWVIQAGGNERIGKVYYFELLDGAGKKLLVSEDYATYEGAVNAVATYKTNIAKGNFRISVTKRGDYMFKLLGGNNQLLCLGEHFPSRRRCEWAIEVVRAFSRNSAVYKYGEM